MKTQRPLVVILRAFLMIFVVVPVAWGQQQESPYRVAPIYLPTFKRPAMDISRQLLPKGATGFLPTYDGEAFNLNFVPSNPRQMKPEEARIVVDSVLRAINWARDPNELQYIRTNESPAADADFIERQIKEAEEQTRKRLLGRFGRLNQATEKAISEESETLRRQARQKMEIFWFDQFYDGVPFDNTGLRAIWRSEVGLSGLTGRVFRMINFTNAQKLDSTAARIAAEEHIRKSIEVLPQPMPHPLLVILPYGEGLRYAWKMDVTTEQGPYRVWIDAEDGRVLQLIPQFFFDSAKGLAFNPDPNRGTTEKHFEVDHPPTNSNLYSLVLTGVLKVNQAGADGCAGALTVANAGNDTANFNVAPINGTVVDRTNSARYNCQFQQVNVFAWLYQYRGYYVSLGSRTFPLITATVNDSDPCGNGRNNACSSGSNLTFGIGQATIGTSTTCPDLFNLAIDATVIAHEFGHILNANQSTVAGGTMTGSMNEGISDFWAYTIHGTNTIGAWSGANCGAPTQTGRMPRQAEPLDVFPEHRAFAAEDHADGQMIAWALWSCRTELLSGNAIGHISIEKNLIKAMSTAGVGVIFGDTDRLVHDGFVNLLIQLDANYRGERYIHKIHAGFAQAGLFLKDQVAVIDINDDYLDRSDPTGPTFTVWTGRDYTFNADETVNTGTQPFNTRYTIDIANDEAFTVNLISSGVQTNVVAAAGGTATWTLPVANWNTLKAQNQIFYRVTTTNNNGGNAISSTSPPATAIINDSGAACTCAVASATAPRGTAFVTLLPIFVSILWRRRLKKLEGMDRASKNC